MKSWFFYKILKIYFVNILEKNESLKSELLNISFKRLYLHLFRSDFLIVLVVKFVFILIYIFSLIFFFKKITLININQQKKLFLFISILLKLLINKIDELILTIIYIQNKTFNEKTLFSNYNNINKKHYTHIVVGSGPSGSISSYYLQKKYQDTLLIEKGSGYSDYQSKHPADEFLYKWKNGGVNTSIYDTQITFSAGECLGGGSEINSGLFHYPDKNYLTEWKKAYQVEGISESKLNECLNELNNICSYSISDKPNLSSYNFFKKGAELNKFKIEQLPKFQKKINNKVIKNSMKNTFIDKYLSIGGSIETGFAVTKLNYKNNVWHVEGLKGSKKVNLTCTYLFLCCGSIETSKILITNKIKTKKKPNSYYLHPMIKVIAKFNEEVQSGKENVHDFQITNFFPEFILGEAASGKQFLKMATISSPAVQESIDKEWKKMSIYHATFSMGHGKIHRIPLTREFIKTYSIKKSNIAKIQKAYLNLCKTLFDGGATEIYILNKKTLKVNRNDYQERIKNFKKIKQFKFSSVHILGGVTSGENNKCIVDSNGKVHNLNNLFINDSSLINNKLLKNPQGMIMAIAKKNIDEFIKRN
jgi:hypothetical protein